MNQKSLLLTGTAAFAMVWLMCVVVTVPLIERDLLERSHQALDSVSLERNIVTFDGRHAVLAGEVRLAEEVQRAEELVRGVRGVATVTNGLAIEQRQTVPIVTNQAVEAWLEVRFTSAGALVRGVIPKAEYKVRLVAAARDLVPASAPVEDQLHIDGAVEEAAFYDQAPMVVRLLARTIDGAVRLDATTMRLQGTVADEAERTTLVRLATAAAPGLEVDDLLDTWNGNSQPVISRDRPPEGAASVDLANPPTGDLQSSLDFVLGQQSVDFLPGTANFTARGQQTINRVAGILMEKPSSRIEVAGHTSPSGKDREDRDLSFRRAKAVVNHLVGRGIAASRLSAAGYGARMKPADGTKSEDRIEFHVMRED